MDIAKSEWINIYLFFIINFRGYAQTSKDGEKSDERMKVTKDSKAASYKATKRGKMTIHEWDKLDIQRQRAPQPTFI